MDYFHEEERAFEKRFAASRDRFFQPFVRRLMAVGVTPNQISLLGILVLAAACVAPFHYWPLMAAGILLYCFCDAIDGPLARVRGKTHDGGSLVDILADQTGVVFIPAAATWHLGTNGAAAVLFTAVYLLFIALVLYANGLKVELPKFYRMKYFLYGIYGVSMIFRTDGVIWFCLIFGLYYLVMVVVTTRLIYLHFENAALGENPAGGHKTE